MISAFISMMRREICLFFSLPSPFYGKTSLCYQHVCFSDITEFDPSILRRSRWRYTKLHMISTIQRYLISYCGWYEWAGLANLWLGSGVTTNHMLPWRKSSNRPLKCLRCFVRRLYNNMTIVRKLCVAVCLTSVTKGLFEVCTCNFVGLIGVNVPTNWAQNFLV